MRPLPLEFRIYDLISYHEIRQHHLSFYIFYTFNCIEKGGISLILDIYYQVFAFLPLVGIRTRAATSIRVLEYSQSNQKNQVQIIVTSETVGLRSF